MARIKKDFFGITGSIDNFTFVRDSRGVILKRKATVSRKRILTHPNSEGTRQNMREMGGASKAAKDFRKSFSNHKFWMDSYFSGRLSGAMRKVVGLGAGDRGVRSLDLRLNGDEILTDFEFQEALPLMYIVGGDFTKPAISDSRRELHWVSPSLNRQKEMSPPEVASHFKFVFGAVAVSNYQFNSARKRYLPLVDLNEPVSFAESALLPLKLKTIAPQSLNLILPYEVPDEAGLITVIGIEFWREINGRFIMLEEGRCMKILGVS